MDIDWSGLFAPAPHLFEVVVRGSIVYLFIFLMLRFFRRQAGAIGIADLLVVVLIADAAQNAMSAEYRSISEGLALVATIITWDYFLNWLGYKFPRVQRLISPPPLLLVKDGRLIRHNLRKQLLTEDELMEKVRSQGIDDLKDVEKAYLEADGAISVIREGGDDGERGAQKRKGAGESQ